MAPASSSSASSDSKVDALIWRTQKLLGDFGAPPTSPITSKRKKSADTEVGQRNVETFTEEAVDDIGDHDDNVDGAMGKSGVEDHDDGSDSAKGRNHHLEALPITGVEPEGAHLNSVARKAYLFALQEADWQAAEQFGPAPVAGACFDPVSGSGLRAVSREGMSNNGRVKQLNNNHIKNGSSSSSSKHKGDRVPQNPYDIISSAAPFDPANAGVLPPPKLGDPNWAWGSGWQHGWGKGPPPPVSLGAATAAAQAVLLAAETGGDLVGSLPVSAAAVAAAAAAAPRPHLASFSDLLNHPSFQEESEGADEEGYFE